MALEKQHLLIVFSGMLDDVIAQWTKEVNTNGKEFNFDSQDCFRSIYEEITKEKLVEEYPPEDFLEARKEHIAFLLESATDVIEFYQKHKELFSGYDREKLMIDTYRKRNLVYKDYSDNDLKIELYKYTELLPKDIYYESPFYRDYGFLLLDYHFQIYMWCRQTITTIKNNFKDERQYQTVLQTESYAPYFTLTQIEELHKFIDGRQFLEMSVMEFLG
ncbi:MAG: hypothetical protein LBH22_03400, partial [Bacteroidales bacterium]|nr:hypothetical protein [Bacteroidales bacterium]